MKRERQYGSRIRFKRGNARLDDKKKQKSEIPKRTWKIPHIASALLHCIHDETKKAAGKAALANILRICRIPAAP